MVFDGAEEVHAEGEPEEDAVEDSGGEAWEIAIGRHDFRDGWVACSCPRYRRRCRFQGRHALRPLKGREKPPSIIQML